jgi:hydrogenase nickel incorporation protein HypA/HybF
MHELSIAMSIVEMAEEEAVARGNAQVHAVLLRLGLLSGIVKEALVSSYEMACAGTLLGGSRLLIEDIPVEIFCPVCRCSRQIASIQRLCCPECGALASEVVKGRELELVALELSE